MRILQDALYHTCGASGCGCEYARGVVIGIVSALMDERGESLDDVLIDVAVNLPEGFRENALPPTFRDSILKIVHGV